MRVRTGPSWGWVLALVVGRFLTGHHLDGRRRSDATFWSDGTQGDVHWWSRAGSQGSWWVLAAGWKRAVIRLVVIAAALGLWRAPHLTGWLLAGLGGPVAGVVVARAHRRVREGRHRRELVRPLATALSPFLGIAPRVAEQAVKIPAGFSDTAGGEHVGSITLPDHWAATEDQKARVLEVVRARVEIEIKPQWRTGQYPMVLNLTRAPQPPTLVPFAEVRSDLDALPLGKVLLGVTAGDSYRHVDLFQEDPHWATNAGSRRGKTSLLLLHDAQLLHQAPKLALPPDAPDCCYELAVIIDPKGVGFGSALAGVPRVELYDDPRNIEAMWDGIARFRKYLFARMDEHKADPTTEFRPATLTIDEINQFAAMSLHHWRRVKEKGDPAMPPVWEDIASVVWMGAQFRAQVHAAGQRLDHASLGGLRDSFAVRMLAGYTPQQYAFLIGPPYQRPQKPRGRFLLYEGGELEWLQLVYGQAGELRDYAMEGRTGKSQDVAPVPDVTLIGLREATARGVLTCTLEAAKRARATDPQFPEPRGMGGHGGQEHLYEAGELRAWETSRPRASVRRAEQAGGSDAA